MSTAKRDPFPLQWPTELKRTESWRRTRPQFQAMFARDRDRVLRQLKKRGGTHIVITSDLPTRNDGLPYANASCQDPGIAVYWVERGREHNMACDRWNHVVFNLRAIDMTLDAMRGIDRWGVSEAVERAFAGFAALPAGSGEEFVPPPPPPKERPWREVLSETFTPFPNLEGEELLLLAKARHRKLIAIHHPDAGGDQARAAELNVAIAAAEKELS